MTSTFDPSDLWPWPEWPLTSITLVLTMNTEHVRLLDHTLHYVFWPVTLTYDLDPWGHIRGRTCPRPGQISWPWEQYFSRYELLSSEFWSSDRRQTEYDAYEPTVHVAQVGSKMKRLIVSFLRGSLFLGKGRFFNCRVTGNKKLPFTFINVLSWHNPLSLYPALSYFSLIP